MTSDFIYNFIKLDFLVKVSDRFSSFFCFEDGHVIFFHRKGAVFLQKKRSGVSTQVGKRLWPRSG